MQATERNELLRLAERQEPQNVEAEELILGGCLVDRNAISRIADTLTAEAFYMAAHREIYRAMLALHADGKTADVMTVLAWLSDRNLLQKVGGQSKLANLMRATVGAVNIDQHAELVNQKYFRRRVIATGREVAAAGGDPTLSDEALLALMQEKTLNLTLKQVKQTAEPLAATLTTVYAEIEQNAAFRRPSGLSTGFYDLDAMIQGLQRADLIIGAGRPSMGKTSFLLNVMRNMAAFHQQPIIFFSLETNKEGIAYRLLSAEARMEAGRMKAGRIQTDEWEPLSEHVSKLSGLPIFVCDKSKPTIAEIQATARLVQAEVREIGLIGLDYMQRMDMGDNPVQGLGRISGGLKDTAKDFNCPVFALSQLSRAVESRTNRRPMMSDLRESGAIEQDADLILMLYRDEYYNPDTPDRGIAEVIISKHRNGPTGTVKLLFEPQFTQFRNLAGPGRAA